MISPFISGANFIFLKFLKQIKCDENHIFLKDVDFYKSLDSERKRRTKALKMKEIYFEKGGILEVFIFIL